jgi:hypothetical protein
LDNPLDSCNTPQKHVARPCHYRIGLQLNGKGGVVVAHRLSSQRVGPLTNLVLKALSNISSGYFHGKPESEGVSSAIDSHIC